VNAIGHRRWIAAGAAVLANRASRIGPRHVLSGRVWSLDTVTSGTYACTPTRSDDQAGAPSLARLATPPRPQVSWLLRLHDQRAELGQFVPRRLDCLARLGRASLIRTSRTIASLRQIGAAWFVRDHRAS
jgi:hypothetical protein